MKLAIIGTGNMGGAIARGLIAAGSWQAGDLLCTVKSDSGLSRLQATLPGVQAGRDNRQAAREADIILLAVKPWFIGSVIEEIRPVLDFKRQLIISVAAGISLCELEELLAAPEAAEKPILFRAIPNTAVEVLDGVTFICRQNATDEQTALVHDLFAALGYTLVTDEQHLAAGTALASCGLAFAMRYVRAAMEGGVELGFRPEEAARIVEHTVHGAAGLLLQSGLHPEVAIDKVTTAGGITIRGLNAMERSGFTAAVIDGLKASR